MKYLISSAWLMICILLSGCDMSEEEKEALIQAEYERKVSILKKEYRTKCRQEATLLAEHMADSIIFATHANPLEDNLYRPNVPAKPTFIKTDSAVVHGHEQISPILSKD